MFKHIKNNKIYIIENKEYVPLNKYLKKKYVGGGGKGTIAEEKLKLIEAIFHIYERVYYEVLHEKFYEFTRNSTKYLTLFDTLLSNNKRYNALLEKFIKIINYPHNPNDPNDEANIDFIETLNEYLICIEAMIDYCANQMKQKHIGYSDKFPNPLNDYKTIALRLKVYLLYFKDFLRSELSKYNKNFVVINIPYYNANRSIDKYNGIIGKIIDFNYRNDNNALVLYIDIDNTEKKIILPRKYISAYKYPHYSHKHKCKGKK